MAFDPDTEMYVPLCVYRWEKKHPLKPTHCAVKLRQQLEWHPIGKGGVAGDGFANADSRFLKRVICIRVAEAVDLSGGKDVVESNLPNERSGKPGMTRQALEKKMSDPASFTAGQVDYLCRASGCTLDYLRCQSPTPTSTATTYGHETIKEMVASLCETDAGKTISDIVGALSLASRFPLFLYTVGADLEHIRRELERSDAAIPGDVLATVDRLLEYVDAEEKLLRFR